MDFRALRRRLTPGWLRGNPFRHSRNVLFRKLGIQRCYVPPMLVRYPDLRFGSPLRFVVAEHLLRKQDFKFLQIGAFDGAVADDLHDIITDYGLRGVLVEPQPSAFAQLRQTYRDQPQVTLLQAAIAQHEGMRDLYCVRGQACRCASFDRGHLRRHSIPDSQIIVEPVACHTVESALRAAGLESVDLIQVDAEGFDYEIIRSIDFWKLRPAIVRFEYRHLSNADADACIDLLAGYGYRFLIEERDIIALSAEDETPSQVIGPLPAADFFRPMLHRAGRAGLRAALIPAAGSLGDRPS